MSIFDLFKQIESQKTPTGPVEAIVVCLGNPGDKYTFTRHNAGFLAADYLTQKWSFRIDRLKFHALTGEVTVAGKRVLFMKPQTYMNASGQAVKEAADFYKLDVKNVIVLCDDITLAPGRLRIREKGSHGGHNGLKSIIKYMGADSFMRVRIGVGERPDPRYDLGDWVLGTIPEGDRQALFDAITHTPTALEMLLQGQLQKAMGLINGIGKPAPAPKEKKEKAEPDPVDKTETKETP